ncbi:MAG: MBL fold metallo-hydrolase [Candidatus Omnitrophica bacterium]|nr:MBL fold metallo-hydrolase [Candidatus Omnitrophota bacterium]
MKIIFLGTNGWFDTKTGNTVCTLIKTDSCNIILDAGSGFVKADRYIDNTKPTAVFLSHLHLDHIIGLHALAKFKFPKGLVIYAPQSAIKALKAFIAQPFTVPPKGLSFKIKFSAALKKMRFAGMEINALLLVHSSDCLGYRFKGQGKTIAYCTDTGSCENIVKLGNNADLLITECALRKGQDDGGWPHLDPIQAALLAKEANAHRLVLTHFDADNYPSKKHRSIAQTHARKVFPKSIAAVDRLTITL